MKITIESDSGSGVATPPISTTPQGQDTAGVPIQMNAGAAPSVSAQGGGGAVSSAAEVTVVSAGEAPALPVPQK
jgi:hypothetical protein